MSGRSSGVNEYISTLRRRGLETGLRLAQTPFLIVANYLTLILN